MKKFISKKAIAVGTAVISIVALLLTGTFAWFKVSEAKNEFLGLGRDVLLHDDYLMTVDAKGEIDKDVYAENTGNAPVIVRIKLQEYMDLTSSEAPANIDSLWQTHIQGASEAFHPTFTWNMGGQKNYLPGVANEVGVDDSALTREPTLSAEVITMAVYAALPSAGKDDFVGWICDTDGFAYWSQILQPGEATGLLLTSVTVSASIMDTDYYYAINVVMEAIDKNDLPMWLEGAASVKDGTTTQDEATDAGKSFLKRLTGIVPAWAVDTEGNPLTGTAADIGKIIPNIDGYDWIVIHVDANGNLLITSTTCKSTGSMFYPERDRMHNYNEEPSIPLRTAVEKVFSDNLVTLQDYAMGANTPVENDGALFSSISDRQNATGAESTCTNSKEGATAFIMSMSDLNTYIRGNGLGSYVVARGFNSDRYWTRSPGTGMVVCYTGIMASGADTTFDTASQSGVRPALFINFF